MRHRQSPPGSSAGGSSGVWHPAAVAAPREATGVWSAPGNGGTTSPCVSLPVLARMPAQGADLAEDERRHGEDLCQIKATVKPQPEGLSLH